ncbi:MAG: enoyl-CoA hydratase [Alphaproteobacteria bacterium]|nr:enoyl-CoA hydratase [Alphaproteobacteria bacterium]
MPQEISVDRIGHALHIRLDRPDKRNAVTRSMYEAMTEAIAIAEVDPAIRAVLFSGAGDAFCAGNDLNDFVADPPSGMDSPAFRFVSAISTAQKVLVAAVHGAAVGIGTTMLLHCDLVVAARNAKLSLPFVALGLVPEAASSLLLPRAAGYRRAAELLLLGEPIDAETALRWGLVNRVVDDERLIDVGMELAARAALLPPSAVRLTKQLLKDDRVGVAIRIEQEADIFVDRLNSPEFQEAASAFFEKRPPDFSRFS